MRIPPTAKAKTTAATEPPNSRKVAPFSWGWLDTPGPSRHEQPQFRLGEPFGPAFGHDGPLTEDHQPVAQGQALAEPGRDVRDRLPRGPHPHEPLVSALAVSA